MGRKSWGDYYASAGGVDYFMDHLAIHKDFLKEILRRKPQKVLEAGCGSAIMSVFLSMTGISITACDRDDDVLKKAAQTAQAWKTRIQFLKEDILKMSFREDAFDLVFSQGVLEHMDDAQIRQTSRESLRVGKSFIFSVPAADYKHRDYGDERLLSARKWEKILFGTGKLQMVPYYAIRTKRNFLLKRPLMFMGILSR